MKHIISEKPSFLRPLKPFKIPKGLATRKKISQCWAGDADKSDELITNKVRRDRNTEIMINLTFWLLPSWCLGLYASKYVDRVIIMVNFITALLPPHRASCTWSGISASCLLSAGGPTAKALSLS